MKYDVVTELAASMEAFGALVAEFADGTKEFVDQPIGWHGGGLRVPAYWRADHGIWAVLLREPPVGARGRKARFWNAFGVNEPRPANTLTIAVEVNPPHSGENRQLGGVFLQDQSKQFYLGHTGKVGGGRAGIGPANFHEFLSRKDWKGFEVRGRWIPVILGPLSNGEFVAQLVRFVRDVLEFKEEAVRHPASP